MDSEILFRIKDSFYDGLKCKSSIYLYGSASTGHWIRGRSDLDLLIVLHEGGLDTVGNIIREWSWSPKNSQILLDGFVAINRNGSYSFIPIQSFLKVNYPSTVEVDLIDQWQIKNRSKFLFGDDILFDLFPKLREEQLAGWAKETIRNMFENKVNYIDRNTEIKLDELYWIVSWSARLLMLTKGIVCESKNDAILWLSNNYPEVRDELGLLQSDYCQLDLTPKISFDQASHLREFCHRLLNSAAKLE